MAAQRIFRDGCEPTEIEIAIGAGDHKSGFAVSVLGCDFLHDFLRRKCGNEAYTGGIACEQFVGEGVDVVIRDRHAHQSITEQKRTDAVGLQAGWWCSWLTLHIGSGGGPSLRLKNGAVQDDNRDNDRSARLGQTGESRPDLGLNLKARAKAIELLLLRHFAGNLGHELWAKVG